MKILARWSMMLTMALIGGLTAIETKVEAASGTANNSSNSFNQNTENYQTPENNQTNRIYAAANEQTAQTSSVKSPSKDKKLIKKTVLVSGKSAARSFRATAYCLKGRTASGGAVRRGIVAADRRVLPLGTKVLVESGGYSGVYTVTDTGGAVKGNVLDIWVPSCAEATRFGRRVINVSVVP